MSLCACCNRPMEPKRAKDHNLCPVCDRCGCTAFHSKHTKRALEAHAESKRDEKKRELQAKANV